MKAYQITSPTGLDALQLVDLPQPEPGPGEILVRIRACSINYRDLAMPRGGYPRNDKMPLIPLSDGAGDVVAVGSGVTEFVEGDKVAGCFFQDWEDGMPTEKQFRTALGGGVDGVLAEYVIFAERGAVKIPAGYSYEQAASLPCAAVTAWHALTKAETRPGQTVLILGTGGVSLFALQIAKAFGARVIATSSSDAKLERVRELGADETINYVKTPDWDEAARELTGGVGVDNVIEVGGAGTLGKSFAATRMGGTISLIGVLTGRAENPSPAHVLRNLQRMQGIYVGNRRMFRELIRCIELNGINPLIDEIFPFEDARGAYEYIVQGRHMGKIVISV
ncbi:MAG: NAD(P)-dependent alcohol dehydrogenase [Acidobacteria bacterium]|nr:NAD(P)-dependent alcohol dehydrogenase [Acidobacteriota bacterium]